MDARSLLVELCVEELPPKALRALGESFANTLVAKLRADQFLESDSVATAFASPRRLAVHVTRVRERSPDRPTRERLMPAAVGLDGQGQRTTALSKRLAALYSADADLDAIVRDRVVLESDGKQEMLFHVSVAPGSALAEALHGHIQDAIDHLPIPKVMTYQLADGWTNVKFVRPAHRLVALHGADVLTACGGILGLAAGRETLGHRFEARTPTVQIRDADSYESQLRDEGAVIARFATRQEEILRQLQAAVAALGEGLQPIDDPLLLDEVTGLVEWPNVLVGRFEEKYLAVPQECLILTMKANQKYFPLLDAKGRLSNRFLIVSNIRPADPHAVIEGNERVIRPRLADAEFFYNTDRKQTLESRLPRLAAVVYHNKIGSQLERIERVATIAGAIADKLGGDSHQAYRAARLAKADLVTDMVGEFPELQGVMGRYYARHDGEPEAVAEAIADHYRPRFSGDQLPATPISRAVALADKMEALTGIFGIGQKPTGDKDPYGLRRAALGVIRMLIEGPLPLDVMELIDISASTYTTGLVPSMAVDVFGFLQERLFHLLREQGYEANEVESVVGQARPRYDQVPARLAAVRAFKALPEAESLAAANKRVQNILRKSGTAEGIHNDRLVEPAEQALAEALREVAPRVSASLIANDYGSALKALAGLRSAVDAFFDTVLVNAPDEALRHNRLALLTELARHLNAVADISRLAA